MAVQINRAHTLGKQKARAMVEDIAVSLRQKLGLHYEWQGDHLTFKRTGITGHIDVQEDTVDVYIKRSRLVPVSESWIRTQVEAVMNQYLGTD